MIAAVCDCPYGKPVVSVEMGRKTYRSIHTLMAELNVSLTIASNICVC